MSARPGQGSGAHPREAVCLQRGSPVERPVRAWTIFGCRVKPLTAPSWCHFVTEALFNRMRACRCRGPCAVGRSAGLSSHVNQSRCLAVGVAYTERECVEGFKV